MSLRSWFLCRNICFDIFSYCWQIKKPHMNLIWRIDWIYNWKPMWCRVGCRAALWSPRHLPSPSRTSWRFLSSPPLQERIPCTSVEEPFWQHSWVSFLTIIKETRFSSSPKLNYASRIVLTAAHCVVHEDTCRIIKDDAEKSFKVISGLYAYDQGERAIIKRSKVKQWIPHQRYCPDRDPS